MGSIFNELRRGEFARALKAAVGAEDSDGSVERYSETLQGVLDLWRRPEHALLRGERLWACSPNQTPIAAEFAVVGVRSPAGGQILSVVEGVILDDHSGAVPNVRFNLGANIVPTGLTTASARDTRVPILTSIQTESFTYHNAAEPGTVLIATARFADQSYSWIPLNVVLAPGFSLFAVSGAVNQNCGVTFLGYERFAYKGELQVRG